MINEISDDILFRKVTLELFCGLDLGLSLQRSLNPLRDSFPLNHIFLQIYETGLGAMRTLVIADDKHAEITDKLNPIPEKVRLQVHDNLPSFKAGDAVISDLIRNPVAQDMLDYHGISDRSILTLFLKTENGRLGTLVLTAEGEDKYTNKHLRLISTLYRPFSIALSNLLEHNELQSLRDRLADDNEYLNRELLRLSGDRIIGSDFGLKKVAELVKKVSGGNSPVLITGETGVGKDVVAGAIHAESSRCKGPFIKVNCGAIPDSLIDSELFGHEKGAFTGAISQKRGRFERANGGTIFLDEIGEMPLSAQVRLLHVLQEKVIERVGGISKKTIDVRIIAATNRNLPELIKEGKFREDLWYRLNVFPIEIPPLRQRRDDIPALVDYFIGLKADELKLSYRPIPAPGAFEALAHYHWPGNVRELANVVERSIILTTDGILHFEMESNKSLHAIEDINALFNDFSMTRSNFPTLDKMTETLIKKALVICDGKVHGPGGAGELLDVNPNTLRHRMRKLEIEFGKKGV